MGKVRWSNIVFAFAYVALIVGVFFALGGAAYASNSPTSAGDQYCNGSAADQYCTRVAGVKVSATASGEAAGVGASALPNTGFSLAGVAVLGLGLVGAGIALRRRERRQR
jgi:LPXTG-motif cell wall-anchored protein